jgi:hypothetical protein
MKLFSKWFDRAKNLFSESDEAKKRAWQHGCLVAIAERTFPGFNNDEETARHMMDDNFKAGFEHGMQMPCSIPMDSWRV